MDATLTSLDQIISQVALALQQHPELANYSVNQVSNIWPTKSGVKVTFLNGSQQKTAYFYLTPSG